MNESAISDKESLSQQQLDEANSKVLDADPSAEDGAKMDLGHVCPPTTEHGASCDVTEESAGIGDGQDSKTDTTDVNESAGIGDGQDSKTDTTDVNESASIGDRQDSKTDTTDVNKCDLEDVSAPSSQGSSVYIDPNSSQIVEITKVASQDAAVTEVEANVTASAEKDSSKKRKCDEDDEVGETPLNKAVCLHEDGAVKVDASSLGSQSSLGVVEESGASSQGVSAVDRTADSELFGTQAAPEKPSDNMSSSDTQKSKESLAPSDNLTSSDSQKSMESLVPSEVILPVSSGDAEANISSDPIVGFTSSEEMGQQSGMSDDILSETPQPQHNQVPDHDEPVSEPMETTDSHTSYEDDFSKPPELVACYNSEKSTIGNNFMKGCKWSPDGTCLVTNSNDTTLRIFNLPQQLYTRKATGLPNLSPVLWMQEGEEIYDYSWLPTMTSADPDTCCVASTSRGSPVHMWDAFTGKLRCSYRSYDQMDELQSAHSLCFSDDGSKLYCGFNKKIGIFNISRPGRECLSRPTYAKHKGQAGIISCIAINPAKPDLYVAGSYSREVAVYSEPRGDMVCMFKGQQGGVTHLKFSPDGCLLYSGGRKDPEILCWDLRKPGQILFTVNRHVATNQRMYFDLDCTGRYLLSGNHDGSVRVWDTMDLSDTGNAEPEAKLMLTHQSHREATNGLSVHPSLPLLATSSGQRHFKVQPLLDDSDSEEDTSAAVPDNTLKIWWTGY